MTVTRRTFIGALASTIGAEPVLGALLKSDSQQSSLERAEAKAFVEKLILWPGRPYNAGLGVYDSDPDNLITLINKVSALHAPRAIWREAVDSAVELRSKGERDITQLNDYRLIEHLTARLSGNKHKRRKGVDTTSGSAAGWQFKVGDHSAHYGILCEPKSDRLIKACIDPRDIQRRHFRWSDYEQDYPFSSVRFQESLIHFLEQTVRIYGKDFCGCSASRYEGKDAKWFNVSVLLEEAKAFSHVTELQSS